MSSGRILGQQVVTSNTRLATGEGWRWLFQRKVVQVVPRHGQVSRISARPNRTGSDRLAPCPRLTAALDELRQGLAAGAPYHMQLTDVPAAFGGHRPSIPSITSSGLLSVMIRPKSQDDRKLLGFEHGTQNSVTRKFDSLEGSHRLVGSSIIYSRYYCTISRWLLFRVTQQQRAVLLHRRYHTHIIHIDFTRLQRLIPLINIQ